MREVTIMKMAVVVALGGVLFAGYTAAEEAQAEGTQETIPGTFDGAGDAFKDGGKEVGEGFRGIGRGVKDTFTGQRSADDYREGKKIGEGVKDMGRGVGGGARAVGREIKKGGDGGGEEEGD